MLLDVAYDRKRREVVIFGEEWRYHMLNPDTAKVAKEHMAERGPDGRVLRDAEGDPVFRRNLPANEVRCDIAEKKSIADYKAYGIEAVGASKRVPVADGIVWLKGRAHIVIDRERAPLAYQEFVRYRAVLDKEGRFKGYSETDNHSIDAARYAVFDLIADPDIP